MTKNPDGRLQVIPGRLVKLRTFKRKRESGRARLSQFIRTTSADSEAQGEAEGFFEERADGLAFAEGGWVFAARDKPIRSAGGAIPKGGLPLSLSAELCAGRGMVGRDWRTNGRRKKEAGGGWKAARNRGPEEGKRQNGKAEENDGKSLAGKLPRHCAVAGDAHRGRECKLHEAAF